MTGRTDLELVLACREGDRSAFGRLVDRYQIKIFNAAYRITNNSADAQDATQAAFLKAYEKLEQFDPQYRFFSWIYKIGVNEALNVVTKRRPSTSIATELPDRMADPERQAQASEIGREIQSALADLTPEQRVPVVLRHLHGLSYAEMSEVVGVPVKTIKSRLFSARRELRTRLSKPPRPS